MLDFEFDRAFESARASMETLLESTRLTLEAITYERNMRERRNLSQLDKVDPEDDNESVRELLRDTHWTAEVGLHGIRCGWEYSLSTKIRAAVIDDARYSEYMEKAFDGMRRLCKEFRGRLDGLFEQQK